MQLEISWLQASAIFSVQRRQYTPPSEANAVDVYPQYFIILFCHVSEKTYGDEEQDPELKRGVEWKGSSRGSYGGVGGGNQ